jgi:hypothetical protein
MLDKLTKQEWFVDTEAARLLTAAKPFTSEIQKTVFTNGKPEGNPLQTFYPRAARICSKSPRNRKVSQGAPPNRACA